MLEDYTCKSDRQREKRKTEVERDEGLEIQISRMTSEVSNHLSPVCSVVKHTILVPLDLTQPITGGNWPYFRLIGPNTRDIRSLIKQAPHVVGFF